MELIDVVDENNNLTGKIEDKDIVHTKGMWHREVAAWIMNQNGEVLIQKRVATKKHDPNKWALTAGHLDAGEELKNGIIREIKEELGIDVLPEKLELIMIEKNESLTNKRFSYRFFVFVDKSISDFILQEDEVADVKYITLEELKEIVKNQDPNFTFSKRKTMPQVISILEEKRRKLLCVEK